MQIFSITNKRFQLSRLPFSERDKHVLKNISSFCIHPVKSLIICRKLPVKLVSPIYEFFSLVNFLTSLVSEVLISGDRFTLHLYYTVALLFTKIFPNNKCFTESRQIQKTVCQKHF